LRANAAVGSSLNPEINTSSNNADTAPLSLPTVADDTAPPANVVSPEVSDEPMPGPSGNQAIDEFRGILGDIVVPEGVDPSFLAALPEEMRQEVINEHLRVQRLRQRPQAVTQEATSNVTDVSPEFLAALPPNIQEEVLAQQRLEQQRQVATESNPNDPVDTEAFFRNLQPSLRQAVSIQSSINSFFVVKKETKSKIL